MTTKDVAIRLYELVNEKKWKQAQQELFAADAESVEPDHSPGLQTVQGLPAIIRKGEDFQAMIEEQHSSWISVPIVSGNFFTCAMKMDVTLRGAGRMEMDEIAVYEVKDGKIVKEQFFY